MIAGKRLPKSLARRTENLLVPLVTSRGVIYRARIAGFDRKRERPLGGGVRSTPARAKAAFE